MKPFQVICIIDGDYELTGGIEVDSPIKVGSIYTVIDSYEDYSGVWYFLEGFPSNFSFHASSFAILPDPSEEVGIEAEQEAIIYQR